MFENLSISVSKPEKNTVLENFGGANFLLSNSLVLLELSGLFEFESPYNSTLETFTRRNF